MTAIALTIAGSDSSGGAGIQADLKTFSALGVYGASVITALTAQNTRRVNAVHDVPADFITAQIDTVFADLAVNAVKLGMLSQPAAIRAVAEALERHAVTCLVVDPVMIAGSGDALLAPQAVGLLRKAIVPKALLLTPNLPEAAALLEAPLAQSETQIREQGERLMALGAKAVLVKGGHGTGPESVDLLITADSYVRLAADRITTNNTHGTGCTLSAAITAGLAKGLALVDAVRAAKAYVTAAIKGADGLHIGHGMGPLHHFHAQWKP